MKTLVATTILCSRMSDFHVTPSELMASVDLVFAHPLDARTAVTSLPSGWSYIGCLIDGGGTRILPAASQVVTTNTPQSCITFCTSRGYKFAGLEYSQ
jgi:hypothetical protein